MSRDPISSELRGLDNWLTREPYDDREPTALDELGDYLDGLAQAGRLVPIDDAPKDGSAFKAILADGETVNVRYDTGCAEWLREDRWYDDDGDGAPDGHCRTWDREDFAGQLLPLTSAHEGK